MCETGARSERFSRREFAAAGSSTALIALSSLFFHCTGFVSDPGTDPRTGDDPSTCVPGIAKSSRVPRLTNAQYDNTIQDLLFLDVTPSTMLAPDSNGSVDQRSWDAYVASAERLAEQLMDTPTARSRVVTCAPSGDGAACARTVITSFGRRAFRRPLTSTEVARFEELYANRADLTETGSFDDGVQLVIEAFLH
jgi:hypothetical protein